MSRLARTSALLAFALLGLLASWWEGMVPLWAWACFAGFSLLCVDAALVYLLKIPGLTRKIPNRFALNSDVEISLVLTNPNRVPVRLSIFDGIPGESRTHHMPWKGQVPARREMAVVYNIRLLRRGMLGFVPAFVRLQSPLGFWQRRARAGQAEDAETARATNDLRDEWDRRRLEGSAGSGGADVARGWASVTGHPYTSRP